MASALIDELTELVVEMNRSNIEEVVGTLWTTVEAGDDPKRED